MSYDVSIVDPVTGATLQSAHPHQLRGGTYCVGGTNELTLNITYNYSSHFYRVLGERGIWGLHNLPVEGTLDLLAKAVLQLDDDVHPDYWMATEGNARAALQNLLVLATMGLQGVWQVA